MPVPAAADIRGRDLDPLGLSPRQRDQLDGKRCARCGTAAVARDGGYAYVVDREGGRLGRPVRVCVTCPIGV